VKNRLTLMLLAALAMLAVACSGDAAPSAGAPDEDGQRIVVVSTFPLLSELAERIGGDDVEVINLIPLGVDEHAYQPSTTVPREVVRADLALVNGYHLEEALLNIVVENIRPGVPVVAAARGLQLLKGGHVHVFQEGDADRAAVDAAIRRIGTVVETTLRGEQTPDLAMEQIDVIIHDLPSRSRTETVRAIDRFVHDVPRGRVTVEDALAGIGEIVRNYEPAPGSEAMIEAIEALAHEVESGSVAPEAALATIDGLLDGLSLDQRDDTIRAVDAAMAEWKASRLSATAAIEAIDAALHGEGTRPPGDSAALIDDIVFAEGDPHLWLDARNMAGYAANIRDALIRVHPEGADGYRERARALIAELNALHDELIATLAVIPAERRKIVVFHDAFQYFAAAYDFEVIASVAPANPNQSTSAAAIAEIIRTVRAAGVPTIYREPQYSSQSLDLIARDSEAQVGIIHSIPSETAPTYAAMMRANAEALVQGLAPPP
jgi:ABC-type Zn uptake system ZnuABC Zn-binding protein ZnuA